MSEEAPQIKIESLKVKKIIAKDFLKKLKSFIFNESFCDFYNRRITENRYYKSFDGIWVDDEYIKDEDHKVICVIPFKFESFLNMYNSIGGCQKIIDLYLFHIKYVYKLLFESTLKNEFYNIKLNKKIIKTFWDNEILDNLYNSKIIDLSKYDFYKKTHFYMEKEFFINSDYFIKHFILKLFNYTLKYLLTLCENLNNDIENIISLYPLESAKNILIQYNMDNNLINYISNINKEIKKQRNARFEMQKGCKGKEIIANFFPDTDKKLEFEIKKIKKEYEYWKPYVKKYLKKIKNDALNSNKYINEFLSFAHSVEMDPDVIATYLNLIELNHEGEESTIKYVIIYTLLYKSGDLKIFENNSDNLGILERIRKYFSRKTGFLKPLDLKQPNKIFQDGKFEELLIKFFNEQN